jgi:acetoin utilization protein AcuB
MFYVSSISGSLTPFNPGISPISNEIKQVAEVGKVNFSQIVEEAAVYEGHTNSFGRELSVTANAHNIARAGAAMAYHQHESDAQNEVTHEEVIPRVTSIEASSLVDDASERLPHRVNPIKKNQYQPFTLKKEKKPVVIASDIMTASVITLKSESSLEEAERLFKQHHFRHIPIISAEGKVIGILSDRDFIGGIPHASLKKVLIKDKMKTNILTARPQTEIPTIAEVMIQYHIGCLPILDENGLLVGILTRGDILRAIVRHAPIELWS